MQQRAFDPGAVTFCRTLPAGRHLVRVWLAPRENTTVIVTDEDLLVDVMERVCHRKKLVRSEYVLQFKPDPTKDKLVNLDGTLQYRQCCNETDLVDIYLTKGGCSGRD